MSSKPARKYTDEQIVAILQEHLGIHRPLVQYRLRRALDPALLTRLGELAEAKPRWGSPRLTWRLQREGWRVNHKRIERLLRDGHLLVGQRRRRTKRVAQARVPVAVPTRPNERWSMDFVCDTTAEDRPYRHWTLVDDATRECPRLLVDRSLPARRVVEALELLVLLRGRPAAIVCDIGPAFATLVLDQWASATGVTLAFIRPGRPAENCFIESFNCRLRDECLNQHHFATLEEPRTTLEAWRHECNLGRPHGSLRGCTPAEYAARFAPEDEDSSTPMLRSWAALSRGKGQCARLRVSPGGHCFPAPSRSRFCMSKCPASCGPPAMLIPRATREVAPSIVWARSMGMGWPVKLLRQQHMDITCTTRTRQLAPYQPL